MNEAQEDETRRFVHFLVFYSGMSAFYSGMSVFYSGMSAFYSGMSVFYSGMLTFSTVECWCFTMECQHSTVKYKHSIEKYRHSTLRYDVSGYHPSIVGSYLGDGGFPHTSVSKPPFLTKSPLPDCIRFRGVFRSSIRQASGVITPLDALHFGRPPTCTRCCILIPVPLSYFCG